MTIVDVIKENMEYFNYSNSDLASLTGISVKTIRNILGKKTSPDVGTLAQFEKAFELESGDLISIERNLNEMADESVIDKESYIQVEKALSEYADDSILKNLKKIFKGKTANEYKQYYQSKLVGTYMYRENNLADLWIALSLRKANEFKTEYKFSVSNKHIVNDVFRIMLLDSSFEDKYQEVKDILAKKGIFLINTPFIKGSYIRGASFNQNKNRYILINDSGKREALYTFTLMHELMHLYFNSEDKQINEKVAEMIKEVNVNTIAAKELKYVVDTYGDKDQFNKIHNNTTRRVDFGNEKSFIRSILK